MTRRPSNGNVGDGYGWRAAHPITGQRTFHYGEDIGWSNGTALVAPMSGKLSYYYHSGFGNLVTITDGNTAIRLAHVAKLAPGVVRGDNVVEGQYVAVMGSTGRATGVHVHWEVLINGTHINPVDWLIRTAADKIKEIERGITKMRMLFNSENKNDATRRALVGEFTFQVVSAEASTEERRLWGLSADDGIISVTQSEWNRYAARVTARTVALLKALDLPVATSDLTGDITGTFTGKIS